MHADQLEQPIEELDPERVPGSGRVQEIELPAEVRELSTLARIDYEDGFLVDTAGLPDRTAEQWAREVLDRAPLRFRVSAPPAWFALGLKHGLPFSSTHLLGWPVRRRSDDVLLLGAESRIGMPAELLFRRGSQSLLSATLITHENTLARTYWSAIEAHHRRVVAGLLRGACARQT